MAERDGNGPKLINNSCHSFAIGTSPAEEGHMLASELIIRIIEHIQLRRIIGLHLLLRRNPSLNIFLDLSADMHTLNDEFPPIVFFDFFLPLRVSTV